METTRFDSPITFLVSDELRTRIEKEAEKRKVNLSELIRLAIEKELDGTSGISADEFRIIVRTLARAGNRNLAKLAQKKLKHSP